MRQSPGLRGENHRVFGCLRDARRLIRCAGWWKISPIRRWALRAAVTGWFKPNEVNIGASEDFYWKYEAFLKTQESRLASTLGAHGHLARHSQRALSLPAR